MISALPTGAPSIQIASDGGLLEAPLARTDMVLAPGERGEILVDLAGVTDPLTLLS